MPSSGGFFGKKIEIFSPEKKPKIDEKLLSESLRFWPTNGTCGWATSRPLSGRRDAAIFVHLVSRLGDAVR